MEIRDRQTRDAVADVATILATAYQRYRRARRIEIDRGEIRRHADLARLGCVSRERISQMMVLTWLAPDIQEAILRLPQVPGGRFPVSEGTLRKTARLAMREDQRALWPSEF